MICRAASRSQSKELVGLRVRLSPRLFRRNDQACGLARKMSDMLWKRKLYVRSGERKGFEGSSVKCRGWDRLKKQAMRKSPGPF